METKICRASGKPFIVDDKDLSFYQKIGVPPPTLCPEERQRRRLLWCNEMNLYRRKCDLCKASVLSMYDEGVSFPVYCQSCWWSDQWDPYRYGMDFDFNRPFFEQYKELIEQVPHSSLQVTLPTLQNSDYINYAGNAKNCYLIFDSDYNENCLYCYTINNSQNCVDCLKCFRCQWCYECVDCLGCYELLYSQNCQNCVSSYFLRNCQDCKWCFGCINLHHKEYHLFNKPVSKEAYRAFLGNLGLDRWTVVQAQGKKAEEIFLKFPHRCMRGVQNEHCLGENIFRSKNCSFCFDTYDARDCKYLYSISFSAQDCYDMYQFGENIVQCYESAIVGYGAFRVMFSFNTWPQSRELFYCQEMRSSRDCFGCFGLRHGQYNIFNKKYSKYGYASLKDRVIEHMKKTGEWGEFFPASLSPFAYNQSMAMDHFPLEKEEALKHGYRWKDPDLREYRKQTFQIPDSINDVTEMITKETLACELTGKNFRITPQEFTFYKRLGIPIPRFAFETRHRNRLSRRNPQRLFERSCMKCGAKMQTGFSPERKEIVYCEPCYQKEVY